MRTPFILKKQQIGIMYLILAIALTSCHFGGNKTAKEIDDEVIAKAETLNKQCPKKIDVATRLDSCKGFSGRILQYNFTVFGTTISPAMKAELFANCLNSIKGDKTMKDLCKKEVTFQYCYKDYQGLSLCNFDIKPQDYDPDYFKKKAKQAKDEAAAKLKEEQKQKKQPN